MVVVDGAHNHFNCLILIYKYFIIIININND